MLGVVDDMQKFNNKNTMETILEDNVIVDLHKWKQVSGIISGKLNLEKYGSYILTWKYDRKGNLIMESTTEYEIMMPNQDSTETRIKYLYRGETYE